MKSGQATAPLIQGLCPGREELVDRWLVESPAFRELCEDYRRCFVALEKLRRTDATEHAERILEYDALLAQLAREVESCLDDLSERQD